MPTSHHGAPTAPDALVPAVGYLRISSDPRDEREGVVRQRADVQELARRRGLRLIKIYEENDVSASDGGPRPVYEGMMRELDRADGPKIVATWHSDRMHRDIIERALYLAVGQKHGIVTYSASGVDMDPRTAEGMAVALTVGVWSQYQVKHAAENILQQKRDRRAHGIWTGGPIPFGYRLVDGKLAIHREEAKLIADTVHAILHEGRTLHWAVQQWNASGLHSQGRTKGQAVKWSYTTVKNVLTSWRNAGIMSYRDEEIGPAEWSHIVSREEVAAIRRRFYTRSQSIAGQEALAISGGQRGRHPRNLLTHIAKCSHCGSGVSAGVMRYKRPTPLRVYRCNSFGSGHGGPGHISRAADAIDELVRATVAEILRSDRAELAALLSPAESAHRADELLIELEDLRAQSSELDDMWHRKAIQRDRWERLVARNDADIEAAQGELDGLTGTSVVFAMVSRPDPGEAFYAADLAQQRAVIHDLVEIVIFPAGRRGSGSFDPATVRITPRRPAAAVA